MFRIQRARFARAAALLVALAATGPVASLSAAAAATPMGEADARHLLARTGFGPTSVEVRQFASLSRNDAIDRLLREARTAPVTPPPAWTEETGPLRNPPAAQATDAERKEFQQAQTRRGLELRAWWIREMLATPSPLTERMTLFWHNHFVSSQQKVRVARLMYTQNAAFRELALGRFDTLLHVASKDPAMILYLDSVQNRKGAPNENFAREVMELFTLGQGHYNEQDIKEAARAFTGWSLDRATGTFMFRPRLHDDGDKTVFGKTGPFDGDAVLDLLLARSETSEFVVAKLWQEFVSATPDPLEVRRIARRFKSSGYDIKVALRGLLGTSAFWDAGNRGTLVKSPTELVVGTLRQLELSPVDTQPFALVVAGMGQNLFAPPNVRGWPGGEVWINSNTLLARKQFLDRLARNDAGPPPVIAPMLTQISTDAVMLDAPAAPQDAATEATLRAQRIARQIDRGTRSLRFDAAPWLARRDGETGSDRLQSAQALLLPIPPQLPAPADADATTAVHALLQDPAFELK